MTPSERYLFREDSLSKPVIGSTTERDSIRSLCKVFSVSRVITTLLMVHVTYFFDTSFVPAKQGLAPADASPLGKPLTLGGANYVKTTPNQRF